MCKRSDDDPLVRVLTDRYKFNILRMPRNGIQVGELLIEEGQDLRCSGRINKFFDPELEVQEYGPIPLPDLGGITSARISSNLATTALANLLAALGVVGAPSIRTRLKSAREVSITFGVTGARLWSTDLVGLGDELASRVMRADNALYRPGRRFFVAHARAEAAGIRVSFSSSSERAAELGAEIVTLVKAETSVDVSKDASGYLVFTAPFPVTFGLAVVQLVVDGNRIQFDIPGHLRPVRRGGSEPQEANGVMPNVFFSDPDSDLFVDVT